MKKFLLLLLLTFNSFTLTVYAQKQGQALIDSLLLELPKAKEDTNKVNILNDIGYEFTTINPDKGIKFGEEELQLAEKLQWKLGIAKANKILGDNYKIKSDFKKALDYYFESIRINEKVGSVKLLASTLRNMGVIYRRQSDYPKSLEYFLKALKLFEEMGNKKNTAMALGDIGTIYHFQNDDNKALEYMQKALKMNEESGNKNRIASSLDYIGIIYGSLKNYPKALESLQRALKYNTETGNKNNMAADILNIGNVYHLMNNYTLSLEYYFKSVKMQEEFGDKNGLSENYGNIGDVYYEIAKSISTKGQTEKNSKTKVTVVLPVPEIPKMTLDDALKLSDEYLRKALKVNKEIGDLFTLQNTYASLYEEEQLSGNYKDALENYQNHIIIKDSIYSEENKKKIDKLMKGREEDLKQKEIEIQKLQIASNEQERKYFIGGMVLLLVFGGFMFNRFRVTQKQKIIIEKEKLRSDTLLLNILPAEIAEELKAKGQTEAKQYDNVSVLFTDFVGFTVISEKLTPQELVAEIHKCFTAFDAIIERNGLEKIKTIGDAYLAVCGLPNNDKDHAKKTVQAAIEIMEFINKREMEGGKFKLRIGINSGPVVAGIVGVKKFAYDIWGDAVNTAARMEQNSKNGKINISGSTYELVKNDFKCEHRGKIEAKNKGEVDMYFVVTDNE